MSQPAKRKVTTDVEPVRVLGRGLRAAKGVHLTLRTIRESVGATQVAVAAESQINQADISRLEAHHDFDDCQVATLRRYVAALGGDLELVARFGDKKIALIGVEASDNNAAAVNKASQRTVRKAARR